MEPLHDLESEGHGVALQPCTRAMTLSFRDRKFLFFLNTIFVSSRLYPENPEGTQVIVGSMNMGYISDTAVESNSQPVLSQVGADPTRPQ